MIFIKLQHLNLMCRRHPKQFFGPLTTAATSNLIAEINMPSIKTRFRVYRQLPLLTALALALTACGGGEGKRRTPQQ